MAASMKLWWQFSRGSSLWASYLASKYGLRAQHHFFKSEYKHSHIWRRLLEVKDLVNSHIRWFVGDGCSISLWWDRWLLNQSISAYVSHHDPKALVQSLRAADQWDMSGIDIPAEIKLEINATPRYFDSDTPVWEPDKLGRFSFKSVWNLVRHKATKSSLFSLIWHPKLPIKISLLVRRLLFNTLPVEVRIQRRGMSMASRCVCCTTFPQEETSDHLMSFGELAQQVWAAFEAQFFVPTTILSVELRFIQWSKLRGVNHQRMPDIKLVPLIIYWCIWKHRCQIYFNNVELNPSGVIIVVNEQLNLLQKAFPNIPATAKKLTKIIHNCFVQSGYVLIFLGYSNSGSTGVGGLLKNQDDQFVEAFSAGVSHPMSDLEVLQYSLLRISSRYRPLMVFVPPPVFSIMQGCLQDCRWKDYGPFSTISQVLSSNQIMLSPDIQRIYRTAAPLAKWGFVHGDHNFYEECSMPQPILSHLCRSHQKT